MSPTRQIKSFYTDGACVGNPGPGGWGTVTYFSDGSVYEMGGAETPSTNNRMELLAAIQALKVLKASGQNEPVTLYTDSEYVKNGITKWIKGWKNKGWKTSTGKDVVNQDLWHLLDKLNSRIVKWEHVRGHSGDFYNDRCDEIARSFSHNLTPELQQQKPTAGETQAGTFGGVATPPLGSENTIVWEETDTTGNKTIESYVKTSDLPISNSTMMDSTADTLENLPRE